MSNTDENLKAAFAGESQANRKYLAFAKKADSEGFSQTAKLFRAIAMAETVHAHNHFDVMGGVKDTVSNLKEAVSGETYEFKQMYPEFIEDAQDDSNTGAKRSFNFANSVEKIHEKLYSDALAKVETGNDISEVNMYVCDVCGHTVDSEPTDSCPICGAPVEHYMKID